MSNYAVIVQNDESKWNDIKGDLYNYPVTHRNILINSRQVIYYKGNMTNKNSLRYRLSPYAHYFGTGLVGESIVDPDSSKNDLFCEILEYREFEEAVPIKIVGEYLEEIPKSKERYYWRFGVREISRSTFENILNAAKVGSYKRTLTNENEDLESYETVEGNVKKRFSSYYERNPFYRNKAIEIHGLTCMVCSFNFEEFYGSVGKGYIHVHHNKPISISGPTRINPHVDLSVLCPNCHSMIHRKKNHTLSIEELREETVSQQDHC